MPKSKKMTVADHQDEAERVRRAASVASSKGVRRQLLTLAANYEDLAKTA